MKNRVYSISKANEVIKNMKSPQYIADKKKRKSLLKSSYYGIDDPFYDSLHEIYGEEGLEGYRKERMEAFKNISPDDVKLASERYTKVNGILTHVKTLAGIGGLITFGLTQYPVMAERYGNPIMAAIGAIALFTMIPKIPEYRRSDHNYEIYDARVRIAQDLGLIDKDKSFEKLEKEQYKDEEK